ncbi:MAG: DUF2226 domain-containing protein [Candidatus Diapherotrites archaeon]|nr:DUF2226 domain-containing protein [Candidatus Diapherotrites archaeon]
MNFPLGKLVEEVKVREYDWRKNLVRMVTESFTGYLVATVSGMDGLEEGVLLFNKGKATGAYYSYLKFGLEVEGDKAVRHFFNALSAENGVGEVYSLSFQQVELVLAFNETLKLGKELGRGDLERFFTQGFSLALGKEVLLDAVKSVESKSDIFKRFGLESLINK